MVGEKAQSIHLFRFDSVHMRAFHMSWIAFLLCFFSWFGIAPLTAVVREEFGLTKAQIGNILIASVAMTALARLGMGWLCDRIGPRRCYSGLLILGALPVMGIGLAHDYQTFMCFRLMIGAVGAGFVITQYHTSLMFGPKCVGTANATTAGWGNMGGGLAQVLMPLAFSGLVALGFSRSASWRLAMCGPGLAMIVAGILYYRLTQDTPAGNFPKVSPPSASGKSGSAFREACRDGRAWVLALAYGACFGVEITIHNMAALHFTDTFGLGLRSAGVIVAGFGLLALFARTLGGYVSDRVNLRVGLAGRTTVLSCLLFGEGLALMAFSRSASLTSAVLLLILFGLFVHMSCGATYAIVPFVNRRAVGAVAGIVGAGGNIGAVVSGCLFRVESLHTADALLILGGLIAACAGIGLLTRLSAYEPQPASDSIHAALPAAVPEPVPAVKALEPAP